MTAASSATQTRTYGYDPAGLVVSRVSTIADSVMPASQSVSEAFTYDSLARLCASQIVTTLPTPPSPPSGACPATPPTGAIGQTYDAVGNILTKSDVGTYTNGPTPEHAVTSITPYAGDNVNGATGTSSYSYDANGNMTAGPNRTINWTSFNLPTSLTSNGGTDTFVYDDQHRRLKRTSSGSGAVAPAGSTYYFYEGLAPVEEFVNGGSCAMV